jgi:hypothetical protein
MAPVQAGDTAIKLYVIIQRVSETIPNSITDRISVLLEKLRSIRLVKKLPAFYDNRRLITA